MGFMKNLLFVFLTFTSLQTFAVTEQEAREIIWEQFNKPDNGITSASRECVILIEGTVTGPTKGIGLNLRSNNGGECGGDPSVSSSIAFFWVSEERELWVMHYLDGNYYRMEDFLIKRFKII